MMPSVSPSDFRHIVRASALYDVLLTAPFATPWSFALVREQLSNVNVLLGGAALPPFEPFHVLICCLLGSIVLVWSALRVRDPQPRLGRYDAAARLLFSTWMAWALLATGAPVLWLFLLPEFAWGLAQLLPLRPLLKKT
ncbi:hypothetical protein ACFDR9_004828 [Janthinobacterium sp. CG_23.3]|uniref:hypothetical protein n=1 Tax=Janthinobacterium sp. CG_23.3 TaxID=3349634 RepID=UPI0038D3A592